MRDSLFVLCLALATELLAGGPAGAECVDYPGYVHWDGAVDTGFAHAVAISGQYAYVGNEDTGVQVVDLSNPQSPTIVASVPIGDSCTGVAIAGSYAFVCTEGGDMWCTHGGVEVIDISDPLSPSPVGGVSVGSCAKALAVSGNLAYVTTWANGAYGQISLKVIDISDPLSPRVLGAVQVPDEPDGVAVSGNYAYVTVYDSLQVVDVSNPWSPQLAGVLSRNVTHSTGIALLGTHAYLPRSGVLQVLDVSTPQNPRELGCTVAEGHGVAVSGSRVFVAGGSSGLLIAPSQCGASGVAEDTSILEAPSVRVFPNPSARQATIRLTLSTVGCVRAAIFDVGGREVRSLQDGILGAARHDLFWDGRDDAGLAVASGIYLVAVVTADGRRTARFVILR